MPRRGHEAGDPPKIAWFNDFHGQGTNSRSCPFLQSKKENNDFGESAEFIPLRAFPVDDDAHDNQDNRDDPQDNK